ncbi:MAG: hypothetical protein OXI43_18745 [Candidatus Poribacteria bacterium]|nr:hypothetical protein [Candidatus Poribacteria bacterium]
MFWKVFKSKLELDYYTRIFTGIITKHRKPETVTALLEIELLSVSPPEDYEKSYPFKLSRKNVVIISTGEKISSEGEIERRDEIPNLGIVLYSLPVGTKIAFTGHPYKPTDLNIKINPQSNEEYRIELNNQYLEVVGFNSTIAKKILAHQIAKEKEEREYEKRKNKRNRQTLFQKFSDRLSPYINNPYINNWLVKGVIVTVLGGLILTILLWVFGDSIKKFISTHL